MSRVASDDIADPTRQTSNVLARRDYRHDITGRMHTYFMDAFFFVTSSKTVQMHTNKIWLLPSPKMTAERHMD